MFLHMKAGLDVDPISLQFSQRPITTTKFKLSPYGVRMDFQKALAELRTDLDKFSLLESRALIACGYQMACMAIREQLSHLPQLQDPEIKGSWVFENDGMLAEITSTQAATANRQTFLNKLREGSKVHVLQAKD